MHFLTSGVLKEFLSRGFINDNSSKVILKNNVKPAIVKIKDITYYGESEVLLFKLFDGLDEMDAKIPNNNWHKLSNKIKANHSKEEAEQQPVVNLGSIIILNEYSFSDTVIKEKNNNKPIKMFTLNSFTIIGLEGDKSDVYTQTECFEGKTEDCVNQNAQTKLIPTNQIQNDRIITISELNTEINNMQWKIKAKLNKKSKIKEFKNPNTNQMGKFIRLQFFDSSGVIELVAFNKDISTVEILEESKIYFIIQADIKNSKPTCQAFVETTKFSTVELIMNSNTEITQASNQEDIAYPQEKNGIQKETKKKTENPKSEVKSCFITLSEAWTKNEGSLVNVIGVVCEVEELKEITPKNKNPIKLKTFFLVDRTSIKTRIALWGAQAESWSIDFGDIIMLNEVEVKKFNGLSLSVLRPSIITKISPTWTHIDLANNLRDWWSENRNDFELTETSKRKLSLTNEDEICKAKKI
jgi:hypothetical protein